jgi:hypothetical protein
MFMKKRIFWLFICAIVFTVMPASTGTPAQGRIETREAADNLHKTVPSSWIEIDTASYRHNIEVIKETIGPKAMLCLVMKSNAYGHGIANLKEEAVASNPAYIAAIYNSEMRELRKEIIRQKKNIALCE